MQNCRLFLLISKDQTFFFEEITSLFSQLSLVLDWFLDHFLNWFLSELMSNLVICCLANPSGLRMGDSSLVRTVISPKGHLSETYRHAIRLGLELELGLGLASNFGICTTPFRTNDPSDK